MHHPRRPVYAGGSDTERGAAVYAESIRDCNAAFEAGVRPEFVIAHEIEHGFLRPGWHATKYATVIAAEPGSTRFKISQQILPGEGLVIGNGALVKFKNLLGVFATGWLGSYENVPPAGCWITMTGAVSPEPAVGDYCEIDSMSIMATNDQRFNTFCPAALDSLRRKAESPVLP